MNNHYQRKATEAAQKALFYEVSLSPKPGLVDRLTNGAHQDMDFYTFIDSIISLTPFFSDYFAAGFTHQGSLDTLFDQLRSIGQLAESAMFAATKNINTHKGANFSLAILLGATGKYLQTHTLPLQPKDTTAIFQLSSDLTVDLIQKDFQHIGEKSSLTHGERLFIEKGITGIRGEAAKGYPVLSSLLLPFLRKNRHLSKEELLLRALVLLMSEVEDGNILHRGGFEAWQTVKKETKLLHESQFTKDELLIRLHSYDLELTARNLSPGGTADLLALGIYFAILEELF
ncbi:MAG: triphosphoribosyl-dephospho-CoA synthase CitG [Carnobacterium sp.]